MKIHPTAIVDKNAQIVEGTTVDPYCRIEDDVIIGKDCQIKQDAQILAGARIGDRCEIHQGAIISAFPQDKKFKGERSFLKIGDDCIIREYVTISRSSKPDGSTIVGNNAYIMTSAHIGHDCQVGHGVTMANLVTLAGHVTIEDLVTVGGMTVMHQFVRVGKLAMVGGGSGLMMDAPPYMITFGCPPARVYGINAIGLKRNNIDIEKRNLLKRAYRLLYRSNLNFSQAIGRISVEIPNDDMVNHLIDFFKNSKRGISPSNSSGQIPGFKGYNGYDMSNFKSLMEIITDEEAVKEIIAIIEAKNQNIGGFSS